MIRDECKVGQRVEYHGPLYEAWTKPTLGRVVGLHPIASYVIVLWDSYQAEPLYEHACDLEPWLAPVIQLIPA